MLLILYFLTKEYVEITKIDRFKHFSFYCMTYATVVNRMWNFLLQRCRCKIEHGQRILKIPAGLTFLRELVHFRLAKTQIDNTGHFK